jgi:hypothetical protein
MRQAYPIHPFKKSIIPASAFGAAAGGFCVLAEWWAVQPNGSVGPLWLSLFAAFPALVAVITAPIALILCVFPKRRSDHFRMLLVALIVGGMIIGAMNLGWRLRRSAFAELAERSQPLVDAIKAYQVAHGGPPASLEKLVPEFLPSIPTTGMRAYPDYEYSVAHEKREMDGNEWMLVVFTPSGGINFDQFFYYPSEKYPEYYWGGNRVEPIRNWAYVHE